MVRHRFIFCLATLVATTGVSLGCRAHPGSLAMMLVGDLVNDADVKQRSEALMGRNITAADSLFGDRLETLAACRAKLGRPVLVMRNLVNGTLVRVYDVRNKTNLRGGRYCVLRFDSGDRCRKINLVGVSASTKSDPARP